MEQPKRSEVDPAVASLRERAAEAEAILQRMTPEDFAGEGVRILRLGPGCSVTLDGSRLVAMNLDL